MAGALSRKLHTRLAWGLMRTVGIDERRRLHNTRWMRHVEPVLARGELQVLGGPACRSRIAARHLPYWGAQAWGMLTGTHEQQVHEALRRTLRPGDVFMDIGSSIGYFTLVGAGIVGPGGRVIALDALRECAEATRFNARLNGLTQVETLHAAVAAHSGETDVVVTEEWLWSQLASVGGHSLEMRRDRVEAISIDDVVERLRLPTVDVVKIDVEGSELEVIAGMQRVLAEHKPFVICEMHDRNAEFCAAIEDCGYRVTNLDGREPVPQSGPNVHAFCEPPA